MAQKITPINKNVLIEPIQKETVSKGGIFIPQTADLNAKGLTRGKIIAVADDIDLSKKLAVGRIVLFNKFSYSEVCLPPLESGQPDRTLLFVNQEKIDGVIMVST